MLKMAFCAGFDISVYVPIMDKKWKSNMSIADVLRNQYLGMWFKLLVEDNKENQNKPTMIIK